MSVAINLTPPTVADESDGLADLLAGLQAPAGVPMKLWNSAFLGPLTEFLSRPGKRFRGQLTRLAWTLAGRTDSPPSELPLVVELLHAGSLIIDDIEDGSLQRRGRAALHRLIGLPAALNLGNWLSFWPLDLLKQMNLPAEVELAATRICLDAVRVCHVGQALDLAAHIGELHPSEVITVCRTISERKTGALMGLAAELGATASGADTDFVRALRTFGERVGVALQMLNDLSELSGTAGPLKHPEDLAHGRITWPWAWAAQRLPAGQFDALQVRGANLATGTGDAAVLARSLLAALGPDPQWPIRQLLEHAFLDLTDAVGDHPALEVVRSELDRLTQYDSKAVVRPVSQATLAPNRSDR
jgi:geranylgeranyl pyrophosphate synthase